MPVKLHHARKAHMSIIPLSFGGSMPHATLSYYAGKGFRTETDREQKSTMMAKLTLWFYVAHAVLNFKR